MSWKTSNLYGLMLGMVLPSTLIGVVFAVGRGGQADKSKPPDGPPAQTPIRLDRAYTYVRDLAYSADGKWIVSCDFGNVRVLDPSSGKEIRSFKAQEHIIRTLALSTDGHVALTGGDLKIHIWDANKGKHIRSFSCHGGGTYFLCASSDGKVLAGLGSEPREDLADSPEYHGARVWNAVTGDQLKPFADGLRGAVNVAVSPDGKALAWGSYDGVARVVNLADGKERFNFKFGAKQPNAFAFSPDGKMLAYGVKGALVLLDAANGTELKKCTRKKPTKVGTEYWQLYKIVFSAKGNTVGALGLDHTIGMWDVGTGQETARFETPYLFGTEFDLSPTFAIAPNGKTVVGPVGSKIVIMDTASGNVRTELGK